MPLETDTTQRVVTGQMREILDHVADGVYVVDLRRRIVLWNKSAQRITGFTEDEVRGHCCSEGILSHVDNKGCSLCRGQCPLAFTLYDGEPREDIVNLHHKDGHRIPVHVSVRPLRDEAGAVVGAVETFSECSDTLAMRSVIEHLKQWGCIDLPTGLANRRIVESRLVERHQEMQRFGWVFGILLIEVDYLRELRTRWGDDGTQTIVRMAAQCVQNSLRPMDTIGRWDDGQFLAVVANTTMVELPQIAERVRVMVDSAFRITPDGEMHATVSIGAAGAEVHDNVESLLAKAKRSLYQSRTAGRNRVCVHGVPTDEP